MAYCLSVKSWRAYGLIVSFCREACCARIGRAASNIRGPARDQPVGLRWGQRKELLF
jgi:hypothetical protein